MIRIGFVGAGGVNFGSIEGPWNHAKRLVRQDGAKVAGVADPDFKLAERRVREWSRHRQFAGARPYAEWRRMLKEARPQAVIIGVPPLAHGGGSPANDIERVCARAGISMFVEKPLSSLPPATVAATAGIIRRSGVITSVGYMLRYLKMIGFARRQLARHGLEPRHVILRYATAYSEIRKADWWDRAASGGPIIEQATHFVDLARHLAGEADLSTVRAVALGPRAPLSGMPRDGRGRPVEAGIPLRRRVPRTVSAHWVAGGGCLCTLVHGVVLHGIRYETDIDIWADGFHLHAADPYGAMRVRFRGPGSNRYARFSFRGDDPYRSELEAFLRAVRNGDARGIRSPYDDALKTYRLTWEIARRAASSRHRRMNACERRR